MKFSDLPIGTQFTGEVTSIRNGAVLTGGFVKLAHRSLLTEVPRDERANDEEFDANPPYQRYIRPEQIVLILFATPPLAPERVPILLDDLEIRNFRLQEFRIATMKPETPAAFTADLEHRGTGTDNVSADDHYRDGL